MSSSLNINENWKINLEEPIVVCLKKEALENLSDTLLEFCPHVRFERCTEEELEQIFSFYSHSISMYHPENNHQERAALMESFEILKKYGMTEVDVENLDFD